MPEDDTSPSPLELTPRESHASAFSAHVALRSMAVVLACDFNFRGFRPEVHYDVARRPQGDGWLVVKRGPGGDTDVAAELWYEEDRFERLIIFRGVADASGMDEKTARTYFSAQLAQAVRDARSLDDPDGPENSYDRGRWVQAERRFHAPAADVTTAVEVLAEAELALDAAINERKPLELQNAERCLARRGGKVVEIIYEDARVPLMRFAVSGTTVAISQIVFSEDCADGARLHLTQMLDRMDGLVAAIGSQRENPGRDIG